MNKVKIKILSQKPGQPYSPCNKRCSPRAWSVTTITFTRSRECIGQRVVVRCSVAVCFSCSPSSDMETESFLLGLAHTNTTTIKQYHSRFGVVSIGFQIFTIMVRRAPFYTRMHSSELIFKTLLLDHNHHRPTQIKYLETDDCAFAPLCPLKMILQILK